MEVNEFRGKEGKIFDVKQDLVVGGGMELVRKGVMACV